MEIGRVKRFLTTMETVLCLEPAKNSSETVMSPSWSDMEVGKRMWSMPFADTEGFSFASDFCVMHWKVKYTLPGYRRTVDSKG